jgi:hypothetical protein
VSLIALALFGCGDDGDGGGSGPLQIADYPQAISTALCRKVDSCCDWADLASEGIGSYDECVVAISEFFDGNAAELEASVAAGRVTWDAALAGSCIGDLANTGCGGALGDSLGACDAVLAPQVANGGACTIDFECISDVCSFATDDATEGTCAGSTVGGPCARSCYGEGADRDCYNTCGGELVCNTEFDGSGEGVSTCQVDDDAAEGESCAEVFCDGDLFCNADSVCEAPRGAGATCDGDEQCESGTCASGACTELSVCGLSL